MRKLILVLIVLVVGALAGYGLWQVFRSVPAPSHPNPSGVGGVISPGIVSRPGTVVVPGATSSSPGVTAMSQKFGVVAPDPVLDYFVDKQSVVWLIRPDGQVVRVAGGRTGTASASTLPNLTRARFSPNGRFVLAEGKSGASLFSTASSTWQGLPVAVTDAAWSADSRVVLFLARGDKTNVLAELDPARPQAPPRPLLGVNVSDVDIIASSPEKILLVARSSAETEGAAWWVDLAKQTSQPALAGRVGLVINWNGAAGYGVAFAANKNRRGGTLSLLGRGGTVLHDLNFLTLPNKCTLISEERSAKSEELGQAHSTSSGQATSTEGAGLICAVPQDARAFAAAELPDDYFKRRLYTVDDFLSINLTTGDVSSLLNLEGLSLDADELRVYQNRLFFINRYDRRLYGLTLD